MACWLDEYKVACFIDSKDTSNTWCVAKIIKIDHENRNVSIRYEGWSDKWDNTFPFNSPKIAPFRLHSQLYTGQKNTALRSFFYSEDYLEELSGKMENLPNDAFQVTQFLRGELFLAVDCLLVHNFQNNSEIDKTITFLSKVIKFIVGWIKSSPEHFKTLNQSQPDHFLTDFNCALASSWRELIFTLKRIFGLDPRTCRSLVSGSRVPENYTFSPDTDTKPKTVNYFINYFHSLGGFQSILNILNENE